MQRFGRTLEINVSDLDFPLLSTDPARHALLTDVPENAAGGRLAKNAAPQILALQNVLPTKQGYSSLDRTVQIAAGPEGKTFEHVFSVTAVDGLDYLIGKLSDGIAVSLAGTDAWTFIAVSGLSSPYQLTTAEVDGELYLHFSGTSTKKFIAGGTLEAYTLEGLDTGVILGITAASGYLLAYSAERIFWDHPDTRGDFTPQLNGAGSQQIADLKGKIVAVLPLANGFIVYSATNAVGAQFSGNPTFPWVFREIANSSGIENIYNVAFRSNLDSHLAWTRSGMQEVSYQGAKLAFPQLTEFLNKGILEDFSFATGFTRTEGGVLFSVKLELVGHRYLSVSYGPEENNYNDALVLDLELKRWGKIKVPHASIFNLVLDDRAFYLTYQQEFEGQNRTYEDLDTEGLTYLDLIIETDVVPLLTVQFATVTPGGLVAYYQRSDLERPGPEDETFVSHFVIGRISFVKNGFALMHEFELQNLDPYAELDDAENPGVVVFSSNTGDPFESLAASKKIPYLAGVTDKVYRFLCRKTAQHFLVAVRSRFELTNFMFQYQPYGRRGIGANFNQLPYGVPPDEGVGNPSIPFCAMTGIATPEETEIEAPQASTITIEILRTTGSAGAATVNYSFLDGTAFNGVHYDGEDGTLEWEDGDSAAKTFSVDILPILGTSPERSFSVQLEDPNGMCVTPEALITVTIPQEIAGEPLVGNFFNGFSTFVFLEV